MKKQQVEIYMFVMLTDKNGIIIASILLRYDYF